MFQVNFSCYLPADDPQEQAYVEVHSHLHTKNGQPLTLKMQKIPRPEGWLFNKFGKQVVPWTASLQFSNDQGDKYGQWKNETHEMRYIYMKGTHGQLTKEREPMRRLDIYDPSHYKG